MEIIIDNSFLKNTILQGINVTFKVLDVGSIVKGFFVPTKNIPTFNWMIHNYYRSPETYRYCFSHDLMHCVYYFMNANANRIDYEDFGLIYQNPDREQLLADLKDEAYILALQQLFFPDVPKDFMTREDTVRYLCNNNKLSYEQEDQMFAAFNNALNYYKDNTTKVILAANQLKNKWK